MKKKRKLSKSGQVTVFIILAILIVVGFIGYMIFKNTLFAQTVPKDLESVYIYYLACIEEEAKLGSIIMEEQAGYIEPPDFKPGSSYMPFSNQLDFLGIGVPYWYYISSNGIVKEQIPSNDFMQGQLNDFIEDQMDRCDFSSFVDEGFEIKIGNEIDVSTKIEKNKIIVNVNQDLSIRTSNVSWSGSNHLKDVDSNLGSFYDLSKKIYENFKETMFLESYGVDFIITKEFNKKFSKIKSDFFIKEFLFKKLKVKYLFVSNNFKFGNNREGDVKKLIQNEVNYNYKIIKPNPLVLNKKIVSSTFIRTLLERGNLKLANKLLNRNWTIDGVVQKGRQQGKKIGFPTCNIDIKNYVVAMPGVYAVKVKRKNSNKYLKGIANLGYRPTFNQKKILLEVHIFNFSGNLYNKYLSVEFTKFIRKEKKFKNVNQLRLQIRSDLKVARKS